MYFLWDSLNPPEILAENIRSFLFYNNLLT